MTHLRRKSSVRWCLLISVSVVRAPLIFGFANRVPIVQVGPAIFQPSGATFTAPKRSDLAFVASRLPEAARHSLAPLSVAERTELGRPDGRGGKAEPRMRAVKVGLRRPLVNAVGFDGLASILTPGSSLPISGGLLERATDGSLVWTASFSSTGAGALRLFLPRAHLPAGSRVYVYSDDGQIQGPYEFVRGVRPDGFWTNSIFSDRIYLEVQFPPTAAATELGDASLVVSAIGHLEHPIFAQSANDKAAFAVRPKSDSCFIDRSCVTSATFSNVDGATRAVGLLTFEDAGQFYQCTGGLLNTTDGASVPYLLTANHCFSTQASATSLEAFWQYRTASCNGPAPDESVFPRTLGSTLLATGPALGDTDFTFVLLSQDPPPDSVLLGWTSANVSSAIGLELYRLSHPNGSPMMFTREMVTTASQRCPGSLQGQFILEEHSQGGTGSGSSGAPLLLEDLRVVGQDYGSCGTNLGDDCDAVRNSELDGAFAETFSRLKEWLQPDAPAPCVAGTTTLCLNAARFRVSAFFASTGASGTGVGVPLTSDSGYFWFFGPENIELIVKILDACGAPSSHFWVFAGGLTNVNVTMLVEDTVTGSSQRYTNLLGTAFHPLQDTEAFPCN
jgi:lysyl endopeptidase